MNYFQFAVANLRDEYQPPLPVMECRSCESCEKTAWLYSDEIRDDRRVRTYQCGSGHLKIVTEMEA